MSEDKAKKYFNFTKDVAWVGISQILIYILGFFSLSALTKSYGAELYGVWAQITVTVALLTPVLSLHLGTATVRYLSAENNKKRISKSFTNMLSIILILIIIVIIISTLIKSKLSLLLFDNSNFTYFILITFIWAGTESLFSYLISYWRTSGKIKKISLTNILFNIIKVVFLFILSILGYSLELIIIFIILIQLFFIFFVYFSTINEIGFTFPDFKGLNKYLLFSIPQIPTGLLLWLIDSSDRYFITNILNLTQTGIYSASYSIGSIIALFYIPFSFVIFPIISNCWENNDINNVKKFLEYPTKIFLFFSIPASTGLYILAKPLLLIITTPEFAIGGELSFFVAVGTIFFGLFNINLYIIYLLEKTKIIPFLVGISALTNILLNIILIPNIGIIGASISTIISYFFLAIIVIFWAKRTISYRFDIKFIFKVIFSSFVMFLVLKLLKVNGVLWITLTIIIGFLIYLITLLVLKSFSEMEKKIIYSVIIQFKMQLKK